MGAPAPGEPIAGITASGIPFLAVRHYDGSMSAFEAVSPHLATADVRKILGWCASSRTFDDKFHGARFDENGRYISGPSPSGLVRLEVEVVTEDPLWIRLGERLPALSRSEAGNLPAAPLCTDLDETPLIEPSTAGGGLSPAGLAASSPSDPASALGGRSTPGWSCVRTATSVCAPRTSTMSASPGLK